MAELMDLVADNVTGVDPAGVRNVLTALGRVALTLLESGNHVDLPEIGRLFVVTRRNGSVFVEFYASKALMYGLQWNAPDPGDIEYRVVVKIIENHFEEFLKESGGEDEARRAFLALCREAAKRA